MESAYQRSLGFFGTDYSQVYSAAVLQSETRLSGKLLLNLGLRAESVDVTADGRGSARYVNLSPRLSLVSHLNVNHSLRLAAASAYRTPSLWEIVDLQNAGYNQYAPPVPVASTMRGNLSLRPEQVRSLELGYRGRPVHWLRLDLTGYSQYLDNLIAFQQAQLPGKATMNLVVQSSRIPTSKDQLRVALFQTFPSTSPTSSRMVPGASFTFPRTVIDNGLPAGDYAALYVCFDVNSDSGMGLCTAEDAFVLHMFPAPMGFPAGKIVNLVADLDAGTVVATGVDDPTMDGCP